MLLDDSDKIAFSVLGEGERAEGPNNDPGAVEVTRRLAGVFKGLLYQLQCQYLTRPKEAGAAGGDVIKGVNGVKRVEVYVVGTTDRQLRAATGDVGGT